jgi:DHA1 family bicyclomycin/chloramphenicol resistance-like MFS transporter
VIVCVLYDGTYAPMTNKFGAIPIWLLLSLFAVSHTTETVCTSALPAIAHEFHILGGIAQRSSSVYFLGFALGIMTLGRISDLVGRRPIVLGGLALYILSTALCSYATNIEMLLIFRFFQAFGASVGSVLSQAMARDSYRGSALAQAYVSVSFSLAFVPSIGSLVGGYIVENAGWVYNFRFLSICVSLLLMICAWRLPETNRYMTEARLVRYFEVFKSILTNKAVLLYAFIIGSFNGMMFGFFIEAPFIFIEKFKFLPSDYGKLSLLLASAQLIGAILTRQLVKRNIDNKKIITMGLFLSLAACSIFIANIYWMQNDISKKVAILLIFGPVMAHNVGHTIAVPLILRFALEDYSKVTGTAGSIFGSLYYIWVALINFTVSYLHGVSIMPFAILFFTLSLSCFIAFIVIQRANSIVNNRFRE